MDTNQIRAIVRQYLHRNGIHPENGDQDMFATGLTNSLFAIQLMTFLEQRFKFKITTADLDLAYFRSVDSIVEFVARRNGGILHGTM